MTRPFRDDEEDYEAYELRAEARAERAARRGGPCQCGGDMPGRCPGPSNCPMCEEYYDE